jgi:hypothetical protein
MGTEAVLKHGRIGRTGAYDPKLPFLDARGKPGNWNTLKAESAALGQMRHMDICHRKEVFRGLAGNPRRRGCPADISRCR